MTSSFVLLLINLLLLVWGLSRVAALRQARIEIAVLQGRLARSGRDFALRGSGSGRAALPGADHPCSTHRETTGQCGKAQHGVS